ncbi:hypothetical protein C0J52_15583, partial [Blattella germanica]
EEVAARVIAGGAFFFNCKKLKISKTVKVRNLIFCARIVCYLLNVLCKFRRNWLKRQGGDRMTTTQTIKLSTLIRILYIG